MGQAGCQLSLTGPRLMNPCQRPGSGIWPDHHLKLPRVLTVLRLGFLPNLDIPLLPTHDTHTHSLTHTHTHPVLCVPGHSVMSAALHFIFLMVLSLYLICVHWRRRWHPTPVLLPGKSLGRRSLVGCSPWGREKSDTTERLHFPLSLSCIGEGNDNPLQCSCLENPREGGAWWAAVYGVVQSWT